MKHNGWIVFAIVGLVLLTGLALMYSGDLKTAGEAKKFGQQYGSQQLPAPPTAPSTIYADVIISKSGSVYVQDQTGTLLSLQRASSMGTTVPVLEIDGPIHSRQIVAAGFFDKSMANSNMRTRYVCVDQNGMLYASQQPCV
jgi:hypothetical protein